MIVKRNGNGQTECVGCKERKKNMPLTWDSWLYNFNNKPYCQECLFEMLEECHQRIDKAIEYIDKCRFNEVLIDMGSEYTYETDYFKDNVKSILKGEDKE